ncbi:putative laccase 5 [Guyanagaster necrorhizus]|uniref:Laccase 5 n=1 Tax=Guyanagaster necrorhizus TaxID=856835 RepID=A0A9P7VG18_9AGAR|nr:putative laccase 5 [Guyanagaster necrorhizus MCA 3950]KAG7439481.1 putative laccase 5 [Guyanagaster necrorhizus MCA 3950]
MIPTALFTVVALISGTYASIGPVANMQIVNADIAPDGFTRGAVLAGGTFPGPLVKGNMGNRFEINVIDQLTDDTMLRSTSIHWHGIFQTGTPWADGPSFVNQCPIAANHSFLYDFTVPDQAGTFWYHSHLSTQYCDGLRGPMVVYNPSDPHRSRYDVDTEATVITLADWYHTPALAAGLVPVFDATLINGKGRYAGGPTSDLFQLTVVSGLRYRLRLISISCDPNWVFSIDGHNLTIIEADSVNTQPLVVDSLQIFAGQRYSVILNANQKIGNYWMRASPNVGTQGFDAGINSGVVHYVGAASGVDPTSNQTTSVIPLVETNLHPLANPGAPGLPQAGGADVSLNLALAFDATNLDFTVNGVSFTPPTAPVLLQILSGASAAQNLLPSGSVYTLPANKVIEISVPALAVGGPHTFDVVRSAGSTVYNYANPVRRDVVSTGSGTDNVTIRFTTDNAGPWFLHCHIDWHLEIGLAVVFAEDISSVETMDPPTAWDQLCPIYDSLTSDQL